MKNYNIIQDSIMASSMFEEIENGLTHIDWRIRALYAKSMAYIPSCAQIERGLTDVDEDVRIAWLERSDYILSQGQIATLLKDPHEMVRCSLLKRDDCRLSDEQISDCLHDPSPLVLAECIKKIRNPTMQQIDVGLRHKEEIVRAAWARNMGFKPTRENIKIGIMDPSPIVRIAWLERNDYIMPTDVIGRGLLFSELIIKKKIREGVSNFILLDVISKEKLVDNAWVNRRDFRLTRKQAIYVLTNKFKDHVSWARRSDIIDILTVDDIKSILINDIKEKNNDIEKRKILKDILKFKSGVSHVRKNTSRLIESLLIDRQRLLTGMHYRFFGARSQ
jgi:hypothetical protein